jgi:hypothetical protein
MPGVSAHSAITSSRAPATAHPSVSRPGPIFPMPPGADADTRPARSLMRFELRMVPFAAVTLACSSLSLPEKTMESPSVRAPDFPDSLDWLHSGNRRLSLRDFRGKLLFLDFWTYG